MTGRTAVRSTTATPCTLGVMAGSRLLINPPLESRRVTKTRIVSRPRITGLAGDIEIDAISVTGGGGALGSRQPRTRIETATARTRPLDGLENDMTASQGTTGAMPTSD